MNKKVINRHHKIYPHKEITDVEDSIIIDFPGPLDNNTVIRFNESYRSDNVKIVLK
jgi:hypothetical protein